MIQTSFLPVKLIHQEPFSGTKDLALVGYTADRIRYAVKRESDGPTLPVSEWIGYHLCRHCSIHTPEFAIVECTNGELAFGSRWEEHAEQIGSGTAQVRALDLLATHASAISAIHSVDRFMVNPDRHAGNFLFVVRTGIQLCLAMDFSMAGPRDALPFGRHPLQAPCNTYSIIEIVRTHLGKFDDGAYRTAIDALKTFTSANLAGILSGAPDEWFESVTRQQLMDWWDNDALQRLSELET
ncbi:hypothetical protein [Paraburkholderia heleia]|uniref:hypothetical protein n=1 Tax=Paraburkholderia heleia TaxID=634127 RepID=UPI002AB73C00|nr:hypothetical protein [Paraburkholderia heleia]